MGQAHIQGIHSTDLKRPVSVYDVAKKELIAKFESVTSAAKFCGIIPRTLYSYIKTKSRCHKNGLNKILAFR